MSKVSTKLLPLSSFALWNGGETSRLRTGMGVSNVNTGVSKPQTIDLNNGFYFMFMSIFLYLSYVIPCISNFTLWKQCVCHVHVCACMDKSCKNTCGNFTRFDVGIQLLLAIPQYILQTGLHVLCHQGTFSCITCFYIGILILEPCILLEMIWLLSLQFSLLYSSA